MSRTLTVIVLLAGRAVFYVGIGFLCLALFEGAAVDWGSAWTYAYLFAWPLILLYKLLMLLMWIALAAGVATLCVFAVRGLVVLPLARARRRRELARRRKEDEAFTIAGDFRVLRQPLRRR